MSRNRSKKPLGLSFERLERREVFAGFTGGLSNGVLTINGTSAADNITLTQTADVVRLDGYTNAWSANAIKQIRINAGAGNDTVRLAVSKQLAATLVGDGGVGHDVLYATAPPTSWTGFEVGTLISPPAGTEPAPAKGLQVVWSGNTGPYTVSIYRRGDGATGGGELYGIYKTRQEAENGVASVQKWAGQINNGGYWDIVKVTVEGETTQPGPQKSRFNVSLAVQFLDANARAKSSGQCALYVRLALGAGGIDTTSHPVNARDYAPYLRNWGFVQVSSQYYTPQKGDVVVFQPYAGGNPAGHIAMFNGAQWVSDFKQNSIFANANYRTSTYQIFRYGG